MSTSPLAKPEAQTLLKRVLIGVSIASGLAAVWLVGTMVIFRSETARYKAASKEHMRAIGEIRSVIARASKGDQSSTPKGLTAVSAFQTAIESAAKDRQVVMEQFQAGSDMAPYLSKFAKETSITGWTQVGIQFTLHGKLVDVMETVKSFESQRVPYEFDSMEISRESIDHAGNAVISARIQLRVLIPQSEVA